MTRRKQTPMEIAYKAWISSNLKRFMEHRKETQKSLAEATDIPKSTIGDYVRGERLPDPTNVQKIADHFNVSKSDIDPRFSKVTVYEVPDEPRKDTDFSNNKFLSFQGKHITDDEIEYLENQLELYRNLKKKNK